MSNAQNIYAKLTSDNAGVRAAVREAAIAYAIKEFHANPKVLRGANADIALRTIFRKHIAKSGGRRTRRAKRSSRRTRHAKRQ